MKNRLLLFGYVALFGARFVYATTAAACNTLQSALPGRVFFPGSEEYVNDNRHYTQGSSQNSTCSVEPASPEDVALVVKGAGHTGNVGFSSTTGVQISMSRFNDIEYDESQSTVKIGAGLTWDKVYAALEPHGVKVVGGRVPGVGVGGLLLGGGYSYFTDQYGLAIDTVVSYDLVLPNGTFVQVAGQNNPDLFFALKGGFNNFGIVTSFNLRTFPQTNVWVRVNIQVSNIMYPLNATSDFNRAIQNFGFSNRDLKAAALTGYGAASFNEIFATAGLFYDAPMSPRGVFDEFLNIPGAIVTVTGTMSLSEALQSLNGALGSLDPPRTVRHTIPVSRYTVGILDEIRTQVEKIVSKAAVGNHTFITLGIGPEPFVQPNAHSTDSAYPHPRGRFVCPTVMEAHYPNAADDGFFNSAVRKAQQAIQLRAIKEGQSFPDDILYNNYAPSDTPLKLIYGSNLARLRDIKKRVDPSNVMGLAGGFKIQ
ncbi:hypothetical protein VNI00_016729 [Paramarasmius palmivorus]|uniref:FAD-binding PCMH-type domain-containing protein n=1 Tax=Paramarasmius palmivorus TaxID=297713 RepID=A0AAW0BCK9_9AGAR